jgi:hypothetical protein
MIQPFNSPFDILTSLKLSVKRMMDKKFQSVWLEYSKELTETEKKDLEFKIQEGFETPLGFEWSEQLASGDTYKSHFQLRVSRSHV